MSDLPKQYDPAAHEQDVYAKWENSGVFAPDKEALEVGKEPFVIMLPPPNITGALHMGHALQDTVMDILSRWHRLQGDPVLWLPGVDHAAIATNKIIEKQLHEEGKTRHDVGRDEFMKRTEDWYEKTGAHILGQMRRLGCSCDWSRQRFTMDDDYYNAVQEAFVRYYEKGYIYRGARIVNWDPATQTTVSDLEIDWKTEKTPFYTLKYGPFEIGTARPETKFGDKYVVMHPQDARYAQYKHGDTLETEWINGTITATVIKDEAVDPNFGSGVMTITPWHDATDFDIAQRHKLDMEQVIGYDGKLLEIAGEFAGQTIEEGRKNIVKKLEEKGLLLNVDENYEHNIALNERGAGVIEPQVMRQWFVDMGKLKGDTIDVAEKELVKFVPPRWKKHFIDWMENVIDWNINRQIWLGHRLPVWWKPGTHGSDQEEGSFVVAREKPEGEWEQDPDVLDTWFSSALWPFATLGWPKATKDLQTFYPTSMLVTGRDILYLWVARMVFSGLDLLQGDEYGRPNVEDRIPFEQVFVHPTVLTKTGQRMSKSLGTGVDPLELIDKYGADATRFGLMHQMNFDSQAIKFDEDALAAARNFGNKVWNIARLLDGVQERAEQSVADEWIQVRLGEVSEEVSRLLVAAKIGEAARALQEFVWNEYADWYLEIVKTEGSTHIAKNVFKDIVVLLHPFMPHITEVLWEHIGGQGMVIVAAWPNYEAKADANTQNSMQRFQDVVSTVRSARTLLGLPVQARVELYVEGETVLVPSLEMLAKATVVDMQSETMRQFPLATGGYAYVGSEHITEESLAAARGKLTRDEEKLTKLIETTKGILQNMEGKAPEEKIIEKRELLEETTSQLKAVQESKKLLG